MSRGNDRLRKLGTKALLVSLLLGSISALETRFQTFRLVSLTLTPWNLAVEARLFYHTPPSAERFWPLSIIYFRPCQEALEREFPIRTSPSIPGWGEVNFVYTPREAFLRVKWKGELWTLSKDGRIWPGSRDMESQQKQDLPILEWADDLPPIFFNNTKAIVHDSTLPISKIRRWLDSISEAKWTQGQIHFDVTKRSGGLILGIRQKFGKTEIRLILPEDTVRWSQTFQAFGEIQERLTGQEKWVQIDATYSDKIVVKRDIL